MSTFARPTDAALVPAQWFDGTSSQARRVLVALQPATGGPALVLHPLTPSGAPSITLAHQAVDWPETWNADRAQRKLVVDLREHGSLEIEAVAQWQAALQAAGARSSLAQRMQTRWATLTGVFLVAALGLVLFYRWGTPWLATQLTRWVPATWETRVATDVLHELDTSWLKPSKLPTQRQEQLRERFQALTQNTPASLHRYSSYHPQLTLEFRSGMGANAFALPGGKIVMTDGIVRAAAKQGLPDDALVGVLAHEIGHVVHRHSTRMVVEQGVLNMGLGLALGDVSTVVSTGASALTGLAYSRNHEREADCYAIALMRHAALPTAPMGQLLRAIAKEHAREDEDSGTDSKTSRQTEAPPLPLEILFSSHPDTAQRAIELEQGHAAHCHQ